MSLGWFRSIRAPSFSLHAPHQRRKQAHIAHRTSRKNRVETVTSRELCFPCSGSLRNRALGLRLRRVKQSQRISIACINSQTYTFHRLSCPDAVDRPLPRKGCLLFWMQLSGTVGKCASERSKFSGALRCSLSTLERDSDRSSWRARSTSAEAIGYYVPIAFLQGLWMV